jgi:hypothetical protein
MENLLWALPVLALCACGGGNTTTNAGTNPVDSTTLSTPAIDLASYDLPLLFTAPDKQLTGGAEPLVRWKEETGQLEITAGDHFGMAITEEPADIPRVKADLERDLLRKNTVLRETPDLIVYRSEFPDDASLVFIHFHRVLSVGERTFTIQDLEGPRFNEQDVDRMLTSLAPKLPS